jgi:multidrug efflux pump subunit AcrA (membrane-fusion protein)
MSLETKKRGRPRKADLNSGFDLVGMGAELKAARLEATAAEQAASEISLAAAATERALGEARATAAGSVFELTGDLQEQARSRIETALAELEPALVDLLAADRLRTNYCGGGLKLKFSGDTPAPAYAGEAVVKKLLEAVPEKFRPSSLTLPKLLPEAQRAAEKFAERIFQ